jgi:urease accessory protein
MRRLIERACAGAWPADRAVDLLMLAYQDRCRRRVRLTTACGEAVLLDLPHAVVLEGGDGLRTEEGAWLAVRAADEPVLDVSAEGPHHLTRLAWHLGNRHVATEIRRDGRLRILDDHVLAEMLRGLGARLERRMGPFQPEAGAYASHGHSHD